MGRGVKVACRSMGVTGKVKISESQAQKKKNFLRDTKTDLKESLGSILVLKHDCRETKKDAQANQNQQARSPPSINGEEMAKEVQRRL